MHEHLLYFILLSNNVKIKIHRTVILPFVLYECETWSLTLREEQWQRVFENRTLMKIFGLKRDEVTEKWRRLQNDQLCDLYTSTDITCIRVIKSRIMRWSGYVARMGYRRAAYRVWMGRPDRRRPLVRPRRR